jgi:hypothetical protein
MSFLSLFPSDQIRFNRGYPEAGTRFAEWVGEENYGPNHLMNVRISHDLITCALNFDRLWFGGHRSDELSQVIQNFVGRRITQRFHHSHTKT